MAGCLGFYQQNQPFQLCGIKIKMGCLRPETIPFFRFSSVGDTTLRIEAEDIRAFCAPGLYVKVHD
jgi:hypothetical protein